MKKLKLFLGLIVVIFIALLIYQNREYFFAPQALSFSLGVETWQWTAPPAQNVLYMGGCLLVGLLYAALISFSLKLKSKKEIKMLNAENATHLEEIASLKQELDKYEADPYQKPQIASSEAEDMESEVIEMPPLEKEVKA
ncbi:MAG: LapA family protein [Desulfobacula sp.]|nr:LapA family protein [Desulfobacula sp.]